MGSFHIARVCTVVYVLNTMMAALSGFFFFLKKSAWRGVRGAGSASRDLPRHLSMHNLIKLMKEPNYNNHMLPITQWFLSSEYKVH